MNRLKIIGFAVLAGLFVTSCDTAPPDQGLCRASIDLALRRSTPVTIDRFSSIDRAGYRTLVARWAKAEAGAQGASDAQVADFLDSQVMAALPRDARFYEVAYSQKGASTQGLSACVAARVEGGKGDCQCQAIP